MERTRYALYQTGAPLPARGGQEFLLLSLASAIMAGMWYLTQQESRVWSEGHGFRMDSSGYPVIGERKHSVVTPLSGVNWSKLTGLSEYIASYLVPFDKCLLWVTLWGVWGSSENLHLFYRLRESYGEHRQLADAPGHLFLKHESSDLATFIQLALIFGWDFYLLTSPTYQTAFVSHDEYIQFCTDNAEAAHEARHCLDADPGTPLTEQK